jgi:hypothetical protein
MPASIALRATAVSALPSNGRITSALTLSAIRVSTDEICRVTSFVASTGRNVTSEKTFASASAFLPIAAIQPWSACGAENPMVTFSPGAALPLPDAATWLPVAAGAAAGSLLVHAASRVPTPAAPPMARKRRRLGLV